MVKGLRSCQSCRLFLKYFALSVLLSFCYPFAPPVFSKTYVIDSDPTRLAGNGIDLNTILGVPWIILPWPAEQEGRPNCHFLGSGEGWLVPQDDARFVLRRKAGRWNAIRFPSYPSIGQAAVFALNEKDVWLPCQTDIPYKQNLLHFDGKEWTEVRTPNTLRIKSLFFTSPNSGWAGCEWGQLIRYDGGRWRMHPFPLSRHIDGLFFDSPSHGYAITDLPISICEYSRDGWKIIPTDCGNPAIRDLIFFLWGSNGPWPPETLNLPEQCIKPAHQEIPDDTVETTVPISSVIWVHRTASVQSKAGSRVLNVSRFGPDDIVFAGLVGRAEGPDGSDLRQYGLFSKSGLERKVVLKTSRPARNRFQDAVFTVHADPQARYEHGVCISDLDGDAKEDLYAVVTQSTNRLYHFTDGYLQKTDIAENAGVAAGTLLDSTKPNYDEAASSADTRNDGSQDLFVTSLYGPNLLFEQIRRGLFRNFGRSGISRRLGFSASASWADVNCDGFIDLVVCNSDSGNRLFLNNGAGIFTDRTRESGIGTKPGSGSAVFGDIDGNGRPDLFVPAGGRRSLLYVNEGPCGDGAVPFFREQASSLGFGAEDTLSLSSSAVFGDPDNDGDLDLFVTNMAGPCRLYLNDGKGRFTDRTSSSGILEQGLSQSALFLDADNDGKQDLFIGGLDTSSLYLNLGGGRFVRNDSERHKCFVSGMACGDLDEDGDPDIYLTDSFSTSRWLINRTDTGGYLRLIIRGTRSNADAVGAAVYLYDEGFAGDPDHLLGMREVSGSSICNSMSSRVVLFGVPDGLPKDVLVRFPSGIRRTYRGMKPGFSRELFEEDGLARLRSRAEKWLIRNGRDPIRQMRAGVVGLFLFLTVSSLMILKRKSRTEGRIVRFAFAVSLPVFLLLFYVLRNAGVFPGIVFPFAFGYAVSLAGFHYGSRILGGEQARMEALEKCFLSLNAFFHGEWGARKLNRIQLYAGNMDQEAAASGEMREGLAESIRDFQKLVVPEIDRLLGCLQASGVFRPAASEIRNRMRASSAALERLAEETAGRVEGRRGSATRTVESIHLLRESLRDLRKNAETHFTCRPAEWIEKTVGEYAAEGRSVGYECRISPEAAGRIRPAEFAQILDNLLRNSLRAAPDGEARIIFHGNADLLWVDVEDDGPGVPEPVRERLFREKVTTRKKSGGFGLYHAARVLKKYGGEIRLVETREGKTVFQVQLKRVDNA